MNSTYRAIALLTGLLLQSMLSGAQNLSNKGKEFWVAYGHHQFMEPGMGNSQEMVLYLSAEQPANVTVRIFGTAWVRNYSIPANTVIATENIPKAGFYDARLYSPPPSFGGTGGEGVFANKVIQITSDVPIVAYAHIYGSASSGATMLMPIETWGYSYVSLNSQQYYQDNCFSWMYVIASEDNTVIEITPSKPSRNGRVAGVPFTQTLQRGQVYQLIGASLGGGYGNELTGTKVRSIGNAAGTCSPIAVFSGSSRTYISCPGGSPGGGDNNMQQIFPSQAWGKLYLTAPLSNSNSASSFRTDMYKVLVKDPTTKVYRNGAQLTGLIDNAYYEFTSNATNFIEADKPVLVAQFMSSTGGCNNTNGDGDPEMIYLSPVAQAIKHIGFYRNTRESINYNFLTLIVPDSGINSLKIDGLNNAWTYKYAHNKPGYTVVIKRWNAAQAQCIVSSDSAFTAVTYGEGSVESYGYNAGTLINNLNVVGAIHNTLDSASVTNKFTCTNTPVELSVLIAYQPTKMVWKLSQLGGVVTPNADVTDNAPVSKGTVVVDGATYYKYTLPQTYTFNTIDTFEIPILTTHPSIENCTNTEEVKFSVIVKGKPQPDFSWKHSGCTLDTVYLKGDTSSTNGFLIDRWKWQFAGPALDSGQNVWRLFPAGPQNVKLQGISKEGCVGDTTKTITIYPKPVAGFTASATAICDGGSVTLTDNSTFGGSAPIKTWYWNFGNDTIRTDTSAKQQTIVYKGYNSYTIKHVVKVSDRCVSDTAVRTVNVYAKPIPSFTYPQNCLPVSGIVQFNNTTTVPDGQTVSTHAWDFGDANATPANPNTSNLASPTHAYTKFGTYNIKYTATTANGCSKDTTVSATFNLKPQLVFAALTPVCENVKVPVSVAKGSVTNGVTGSGTYRGPGTDAMGNLKPSQAGAGTHTIWYVFTTTAGCKDSISANITVYPKPAAAFTASPDVCLGQAATITDQSQIASGNISSWKWTFGDGGSATNTNGNPFTRTYTTHNTYNVKLVAISDNGCVSDTITHTVAVHPKPIADFALPAALCLPQANAVFTNASKVADNSSLSYRWNFGDGSAVATTPNPSHIYAAGGTYNVQLRATSAFGCVHDTAKVLDKFYNKPIASFSVEPDTLCQGTDNVFTDASTAPNSSITKWSWDFGDGSTATTRNPVKRYNSPGNYDVTLTVTNSVGCVSNVFSDKVIVYLQPVIDAGPSFTVTQGTLVQFRPTANDSSVLSFLWTPAGDLTNPAVLRPSLIAMQDQTYTLTATGQGNCAASDALTVTVLKPVNVPNAFSPNGDGINDTWAIPNLGDYPGATVDVYNRYGQRVFSSTGYGTPWDGTWNGKMLPLATYYYVIKLQNGFRPLTGYVTILR